MRSGRTHYVERSAPASAWSTGRKVVWTQLEPGALEVRYAYVEAPPVMVSYRHHNLKFSAQVTLPPRTPVVGITSDSITEARINGRHFDSASITTSSTVIDMITNGPIALYSVSIDEGALAREFPSAPDALSLLENVQGVNAAQDPLRAARLRRFFERLFFGGAGAPAGTASAPPAKKIFGTLVPLLAASVDRVDNHAVEASKCLTRRLAAVRACEAYMRDHLDESVTLLDLSLVSEMRSRSLINAFSAVTGLSPMDYLRRLRLTGVYNALLRADKAQTRIIDVAADWGFWHLGHFISHYHELFGETPGQTLVRW